VNWTQISTAVITLTGGAFFYLLARLPGTTYFIPNNVTPIVIAENFGLINQALPSLIHPFAFILLTVGILGCKSRKGILLACIFWFVLVGLFEALQHEYLSQQLVPLLPEWFSQIFILENFRTYMTVGRFDWLDMGFITFGVIAAFIISTITRQEGVSYEK